MRLLSVLLVCFNFSSLYASHSDEESILVINAADNECFKELVTLNEYYSEEANKLWNWQDKIEKTASLAFSSTGMISLYFLGADLVNESLGIDKLGYVLGPLFELPVACIAYQAQNSFIKQLKKKCNSHWRSLEANEKSCVKKLAKGGYYILVGSLGGIMSSVAVYYTNYYLEPMIGKYVWIFIVPACLSNTLMASLGTMSLLNFFSSSLTQHVFKDCQSSASCKREQIKKTLSTVIARVKNQTVETENELNLIQSKKILEMIEENRSALSEQQPSQKSDSKCYEKGKAASGWAGGLLAIVGSIAMVPATQVATYAGFIWLGMDSSAALPLSSVCGILGGVTMAGYRGNSNKGTFQRIFDMGSSCLKSNSEQPSSNFCDKIKTIAGETATWATSIAAVAPRVQIILYSMEEGPLRDVVVGCNIIATACNDYFGWKKFPEIIKDYFFIKNDKDKVIAMINQMMTDIDSISEDVIDKIYEKLVSPAEELGIFVN